MKKLVLLAIILGLVACAPAATVTWSDGTTVEVTANKRGMLVKAEDGKGKKVEVDDRGRPSIVEGMLQLWTIKTISD